MCEHKQVLEIEIVDEYSHHICLFLMFRKSDVISMLPNFLNLMENQFKIWP